MNEPRDNVGAHGDAPDEPRDNVGAHGNAPDEPRARGEQKPFHFWRTVGTVSSLGWSMVLPIVGGALLGNYLDKVTGREYVWTVGLLFGGVAMSLYNMYHILFKEMN